MRFAWALALPLLACVPDGPPQSGALETDAVVMIGKDAEVPVAEDAGVDAEVPDVGAAPMDASVGLDATETSTEGEVTLATVGHAREFRGVWVATVSNINFPSRTGLSVQAAQDELTAMVDACAAINLNAIVFQVRPESDALYASALEPWSRFLTGTQGGDPGFDPLEFLIAAAHARAIEVHAWLNPYRAKSSASSVAVLPHISLVEPDHAHQYGNALWMDPAAAGVQQRTVDVISDLVGRYALDGIHFDDYFYPYPNGDPFPDDLTYAAYLDGGGALELDDWRRENVHDLVRAIHDDIVAAKPWVRFGIAPFGIYRPGTPPGISGLDQYAAIYSDPVRWIDEGWVEYLAPQLYWPTTQTAQAYEVLLEWWVATSGPGTHLFTGNYLSRLGDAGWDLDQFRAQLDLNRTLQPIDRVGEIFFQIDPIMENRQGINDVLLAEYYPRPALTPVVATMPARTLAPPEIMNLGDRFGVAHSEPEMLRAYLVYRQVDAAYELDRILPATVTEVTLEAGTWAISAADVAGIESQGVVLVVE